MMRNLNSSRAVSSFTLKERCELAMEQGRRFDLADCVYGETDGCCPFIARPTSYYFFLAGLVHREHLLYILETGTHCGGSVFSMSKGIRREDMPNSKLVTIDVTCKNEAGFGEFPHIRRIHGDALSSEVFEEAVSAFDRPIDLLYIDSLHEYEHTRKVLDSYARTLNPHYMIIDDILLTGGMRKLWNELCAQYKENAFDASAICRRYSVGFGVIMRTEKFCKR